jgi:hypothetical protein
LERKLDKTMFKIFVMHSLKKSQKQRIVARATSFGLMLIVLLTWVGLPGVASAQTARPPSGTECKVVTVCQVGPYKLNISFDRATLNTTDEFLVTVQQVDGQAPTWQLQDAQVIPSGKTSATTVKYDSDRLLASSDPTKRQIRAYFPISGSWWIYFGVNSPAGLQYVRIAVSVEPPTKMPDWLAWTIALSPILGILGFFIGQWRLVVRRRREEQTLVEAQESIPENEEQAVPSLTT